MNNYILTSIQENNGNCFLQTPYYWGPGIPVHASKDALELMLSEILTKSVDQIFKKGEVELFWIDEKQNQAILAKLHSKRPELLFLPDGLRQQVRNVLLRKQPYGFFVDRNIAVNQRGFFEMKLWLSCEIEPNPKGLRHGYNMSIIAGTSIYKVLISDNLEMLSIIENKEQIMPNNTFKNDINSQDFAAQSKN